METPQSFASPECLAKRVAPNTNFNGIPTVDFDTLRVVIGAILFHASVGISAQGCMLTLGL
jgi:hypothetical protein